MTTSALSRQDCPVGVAPWERRPPHGGRQDRARPAAGLPPGACCPPQSWGDRPGAARVWPGEMDGCETEPCSRPDGAGGWPYEADSCETGANHWPREANCPPHE